MSKPFPLAAMRRLYDRGLRARGLVVDCDGVALGPSMVLVRRTPQGYRVAGADDLALMTRIVFGEGARFERLSLVLSRIAQALEAGDLVKAQLLGLEIPLETLDDEQLKRLGAAASLLKAGFDPDQPRDERGRWATESSGAPAPPIPAPPRRKPPVPTPAPLPRKPPVPGTTPAQSPNAASPMPSTTQPARSLSISDAGLRFIMNHEGDPRTHGPKLNVYLDNAGYPTIGYGHKLRPGESFPNGITEEQARQLLRDDVAQAESIVRQNVTVNLTQSQFDALVSFAFNVKPGPFRNSTLLRQLNAGNYAGAAEQFLRWNHSTDQKTGQLVENKGLTNRRNAERNIFLNGTYR